MVNARRSWKRSSKCKELPWIKPNVTMRKPVQSAWNYSKILNIRNNNKDPMSEKETRSRRRKRKLTTEMEFTFWNAATCIMKGVSRLLLNPIRNVQYADKRLMIQMSNIYWRRRVMYLLQIKSKGGVKGTNSLDWINLIFLPMFNIA